MRVANADSDWDIHCFYLPRDPAAAWCGVGERHNFEKQVYGPRRTGAPADEPDVELGFHDALRVARLVAKGDQMTLEILLSRPVYAIAEENVASMASREADGVVEEKLRVDGVKSGRGRGDTHRLSHTDKAHKRKKLDWNNLGGHEPARLRVVGQVLDAPERLREVVEALS